MTFKEWLVSKDACRSGRDYAGDRTLADVWATLDRPDYMEITE